MQFFLKDEDNIIKDNKENIVEIEIKNKETYHHLVNVLRVKENEKVIVVIDNIKYICKVIEIFKNKIVLENLKKEKKENKENKEKTKQTKKNNNLKYSLVQGIPKAKKIELITEKITEIGIDEINIVEFERSIVRKKDFNNSKIERLLKKAESAAMQSKRLDIPNINKVLTLNEYLEKIKEEKSEKIVFVFYENQKESLKEQIEGVKKIIQNKICEIIYMIGPEGGITEKEIGKINGLKENKNIKVYISSLGENILRTETAAISALSILKYEFGGDF